MNAERIQAVRNSVAEGRLILRTGSHHGRKLSAPEMLMVRRSVENDLAKLGESRIANYTMRDVTPAGYGPA